MLPGESYLGHPTCKQLFVNGGGPILGDQGYHSDSLHHAGATSDGLCIVGHKQDEAARVTREVFQSTPSRVARVQAV